MYIKKYIRNAFIYKINHIKRYILEIIFILGSIVFDIASLSRSND